MGLTPISGGGTPKQVWESGFQTSSNSHNRSSTCGSDPHLGWGGYPSKSGNRDFKLIKTAIMGQNLKPKILKIGRFRGLLPITKKDSFEKISPPRVCSAGTPPLRSGQTKLLYTALKGQRREKSCRFFRNCFPVGDSGGGGKGFPFFIAGRAPITMLEVFH